MFIMEQQMNLKNLASSEPLHLPLRSINRMVQCKKSVETSRALLQVVLGVVPEGNFHPVIMTFGFVTDLTVF